MRTRKLRCHKSQNNDQNNSRSQSCDATFRNTLIRHIYSNIENRA